MIEDRIDLSNLHTKVISRTALTGPNTEAAECPKIGGWCKEIHETL